MRVAAHQLSLVILHTMDNRSDDEMFVIITSLIKPLVYYGIRSHRAQHIFFSLTKRKKEMASVEEIRQELDEAKKELEEAKTAFANFEGDKDEGKLLKALRGSW